MVFTAHFVFFLVFLIISFCKTHAERGGDAREREGVSERKKAREGDIVYSTKYCYIIIIMFSLSVIIMRQ